MSEQIEGKKYAHFLLGVPLFTYADCDNGNEGNGTMVYWDVQWLFPSMQAVKHYGVRIDPGGAFTCLGKPYMDEAVDEEECVNTVEGWYEKSMLDIPEFREELRLKLVNG